MCRQVVWQGQAAVIMPGKPCLPEKAWERAAACAKALRLGPEGGTGWQPGSGQGVGWRKAETVLRAQAPGRTEPVLRALPQETRSGSAEGP